MKNILLLLLLISFNIHSFAQKVYTVNDIPNPKTVGQDYFVSNPDGILTNVGILNQRIAEIEKKTKVEIAVVAIYDFDKNQEDFEFAKELFETWKIGKAQANNGLLLVIAIDRRKYRFITGSGLEGLLPDVVLKQTGENLLVPAFKKGQYDEGVLAVIDEIEAKLTNTTNQAEVNGLMSKIVNSNQQWQFTFGYCIILLLLFFIVFKIINKKIPKSPKVVKDIFLSNGCAILFVVIVISIFVLFFTDSFYLFSKLSFADFPVIIYIILAVILFFKYTSYVKSLRFEHFDDENFLNALSSFNQKNFWLLLFSPLILFAFIFQVIKKAKTTDRFKPLQDSKKNNMIRLDRDINIDGSPFLNKGQRREEIIKVYDYDIWENAAHTEHIIKAWPAEKHQDFEECPKCKFRTFSKPRVHTITPATYSSSGEAEQIKRCEYCDYEEFIKKIILSKLIKSSSSSSSFGSSSSSSSSSSSGSFGGGSSSGGGAGGSW
ncbi:TPM domain-containing protein [Pedobacter boryungensis]|uniref:TPM domain-containing protein n=1 Tax=Pedobacter boryungensis TaxID=869962 RepID=A0ABX2DID4_9SPHI|nr:TPM domain-containing protein [Pedobacter boryungensis]NQX33051.1 TPM domain-containing protein [Pedobacter boryungensis]